MENFGLSMLCYWSAYIIVTIIGVLHTIFNIKVRHMKPMDDKSMGESYEKTKPWHPLYNLVIFPIFAFLYLSHTTLSLSNAALTSLTWGGITVVFDLIGWVIIKHPWSLTFKQFYIEYQPWITMIYLTIFASPFIAFAILNII